jgi:hypothetical protein
MKNTLNKISILAILFIGLLSATTYKSMNLDSSKEEIIVKEKIIKWADSVFYFHENYRFEQFKAHYTDDYEMAMMRLDMYNGKLSNLERTKSKGFYKKTDAEYESEHKKLSDKVAELKGNVDRVPMKVNYYEILFWSNIKTNHGMTVYYSHHIKLDNDFNFKSTEIKSEIGKKNSETKILYAADVKKKR